MIVSYSADEPEFAWDFSMRNPDTGQQESVMEFVRRNSKKLKINAVRVLVSGILIATIPFAALSQGNISTAAHAASGKYSMAYLYIGSAQDQIGYVKNTQSALNTVSPSWFDINADGTLNAKYVSPQLMKAMHDDGIKVVPFLSNHWNREAGQKFLQEPERWATALAKHVQDSGLDGLNIDIENVTHEQKDQYTEFVRLLRQKIPSHKEISVAVAANPKGWTQGWHGSYDYAALGKYADHLFIMAYDESYQGGSAGPVASVGWVEDSIKYALKHVPSGKIVLGMPMFGRLWSNTGFNGQGVYLNLADTLLSAYYPAITFDTASQSPKAVFTVKSEDPAQSVLGKKLTPGTYTLWFENKASIEKKLSLVTKYNLKGAGSWALGQDTKDIWKDYTAVLNNRVKPSPPTAPPPAASTAKPGGSTAKPGGSTQKAQSGGTSGRGSAAAGGQSSAQSSATDAARTTDETQSASPEVILIDDNGGGGENGDVDLPVNMVDQGQVKEAGADVLDSPGGSPVGRIAAGTFVLIIGVSMAGYYKIRWKRKNGYVRREDIEPPEEFPLA